VENNENNNKPEELIYYEYISWDMERSSIALAVLVGIIVCSLGAYLVSTHSKDIIKNIFGEVPETIKLRDLVDVHYIGRYASNHTIFDSSYEDPENKTGGEPLKVFVSLNMEDSPPDEYLEYSNLIGFDFVEGFIEGLVGLKIGESAKIGPLSPEKAYGVSPKIGDVINLSEITGEDFCIEIIEIKENEPMPSQYASYLGEKNTTIYIVRESHHYVGEYIDLYVDTWLNPLWENATIVTKVNQTHIWTYTTPTRHKNLTWVERDTGYTILYPENSTEIISVNEESFTIFHSPSINDTIYYYQIDAPSEEYVVKNITEDKIITYSPPENTTREFNRTQVVPRNRTQNITHPFPKEFLEMMLSGVRSVDPSLKLSVGPLADERVYFEVEIIKIYRPS
jgi:hypothetical protein